MPPTPSHVIQPQIMMQLLPNLTISLTSLLLKPAFLIQQNCLPSSPKKLIFISSDHTTFFQSSTVMSFGPGSEHDEAGVFLAGVRGLAPETQLGTININVMMTPRSGVSVDDDEVDGVGDEIGDVDDNEVDGVGDKVGGVNTSVQCVDLMLEVIPGPQWTTAFGSIYIRTANLLWAPSDVR
ncbi:hypothetical protein NDA12_004111 [Ustilago hordei]|nr:hypothetical protein NDA12_004111 [Ustilago hordei]